MIPGDLTCRGCGIYGHAAEHSIACCPRCRRPGEALPAPLPVGCLRCARCGADDWCSDRSCLGGYLEPAPAAAIVEVLTAAGAPLERWRLTNRVCERLGWLPSTEAERRDVTSKILKALSALSIRGTVECADRMWRLSAPAPAPAAAPPRICPACSVRPAAGSAWACRECQVSGAACALKGHPWDCYGRCVFCEESAVRESERPAPRPVKERRRCAKCKEAAPLAGAAERLRRLAREIAWARSAPAAGENRGGHMAAACAIAELTLEEIAQELAGGLCEWCRPSMRVAQAAALYAPVMAAGSAPGAADLRPAAPCAPAQRTDPDGNVSSQDAPPTVGEPLSDRDGRDPAMTRGGAQ